MVMWMVDVRTVETQCDPPSHLFELRPVGFPEIGSVAQSAITCNGKQLTSVIWDVDSTKPYMMAPEGFQKNTRVPACNVLHV